MEKTSPEDTNSNTTPQTDEYQRTPAVQLALARRAAFFDVRPGANASMSDQQLVTLRATIALTLGEQGPQPPESHQ